MKESTHKLVRCLGPGPEHTFYPAQRGSRVCGTCSDVIKRMRLSPLMERAQCTLKSRIGKALDAAQDELSDN